MEGSVKHHKEERENKRNELAQWLLLVPLILLLLFGCGTCGMMRGQTAYADTRSQMNADYRPWPFMVLQPVNPDIVDEIQRDAEYYPGPGGDSLNPVVEPGDFWATATPTAALDGTPTATELASSTPSATMTPTGSTTATMTATETATSTDTGTPEASSTPSMTASPTNTPTETSIPWPPPPVPPPGPPPNTYWFYDDTTPYSYMMYTSIPSGTYRSGSSGTYYSPQFTSGRRLLAGTTTVRFYAYNPSASTVSLSVQLRAGSTVIGSASFALPGNVTSAYFFSASFANIEHDFISGERLILQLSVGSPGTLFWDGAYHYSGVQIPAVVSVPTPTSTRTSTITNTATVTNTPTITNTPTRTNTPAPTNTTAPPPATATNTPAATNTSVASDTPTATATDTPIASDTPTATATDTPVASDTPTATATDTPVATDTPTPTSTDTPTPTLTETPTPTSTETPTPTSTETPMPTSTETPTPTSTETPTPTSTETPTPTSTDTPTPTSTETPTPTSTETPTPTSTETPTPTSTETPTPTPTATATPSWWDCDWGSRIALTFDNSGQSEDLIEFPVLITLNSSRIDYTKTQDAGEDIRFIDADGVTELNYEIEEWNESGTSYVWVKVPQIDGLSSTDFIWLYFNNPSAVYEQTPADEQAVWSNGYLGVWHLNETVIDEQVTGLHIDASGNGNDGGQRGNASTAGWIAGGQDFDGFNDYINVASLMGTPANISISAWANLNTADVHGAEAVSIGDHVALRLDLDTQGSQGFYYYSSGNWRVTNSGQYYAGTGWHHFAYQMDDANNIQRIIIDGSVTSTAYSESILYTGLGSATNIGRHGDGNTDFDFDGQIDEARISSVARSTDWVAGQYLSMTDLFVVPYGTEELSTSYCPATATPTPTETPTPTATATNTPTPTATSTPTPTATATPSWWDCDWDYRIKLTFDNLAQSENLDNFPVLVTLNSGHIDYSQTQDLGEDIRFIDSDGFTVLAHEIEEWNEGGDSYVWVNVPRIDGSSNTDYIWMYYGNTAAGDGQDADNTWVNYRAVWHLSEDQAGTGNTGLYQDSTSNSFDGDDQISATGKDGQIAAGQEFDGADDYIYLGTTNIVDGTDTFTFTAWVNLDSLPGLNDHYGIFSRYPGVDNGSFRVMAGQWAAANDSHLDISTNDGTWHDMLANSQASTGTWTYLAAVYDGAGTVDFYFNGNPDGSVAFTEPSVVAGAGQYIGAGETGIFRLDGFIDELRLSTTVRSSDWIAAQFESMSDTFITYGVADSSASYCPATSSEIVVAGVANASGNADFATLRYTEDGTLDSSFDGDGIVTTAIGTGNDIASDVAIQSDGKIVVAGWNVVDAGNHDFNVVRYNDDGSLDTTFDANGIVITDINSSYDHANAVAIQPDGKIVAIGSSYNGTDIDFAIVRYNSDGSLDTSFDSNGVVMTDVNSADNRGLAGALQSDGKIVVAGWGDVSGDANFMVARYNTDGSLDTTFDSNGVANVNVGSGEDEEALAVAIQPDGKIILAGYVINNFSGHERLALVRFNADGSLDTTFDSDGIVTTNVVSGDNERANGIALQDDGKIVVVGYADTDVDFAVLRYNADGSLDTTFDSDGMLLTDIFSGGDDSAVDVAIHSDGRIFVIGFGTNVDTHVAIVSYNSDGSLDTTFDGDGIVTTDVVAGDDVGSALIIE